MEDSIIRGYPSSDPGAYRSLSAINVYGTMCAAWDAMPNTPWYSYCDDDTVDWGAAGNNWCQAPWCYVSSSCSTATPSSVFAGSEVAFYSYEVCGAPNCYGDAWSDDKCPFNPPGNSPYKVFKGEGCECAYAGNAPT